MRLLNVTWDLSKSLVLEDTVFVVGNDKEAWNALNYSIVNTVWGKLNTTFIGLRVVNPHTHPRSLNPYYEYNSKLFSPDIIVVPINGTIKWELLDTIVNITEVNGSFYITIGNYAEKIAFSTTTQDTQYIRFNITREDLEVPPGIYYVKFRIVDRNATHVKILELGSRETQDWLSEYYGAFSRSVTPYLPLELFKQIDSDDIMWCVNEITSFYKEMISVALRYEGSSLYILEYSLFEQLRKALEENIVDERMYENITKVLVSGLEDIIELSENKLGEISIMLYIPYSYSEHAISYTIEGLYHVGNSIYRVENLEKAIHALLEHRIRYELFSFNNALYARIWSNNVVINGYGGISYGYIITYPSDTPGDTGIVADTSNVVGYIASLAKGFGKGMATIMPEIDRLSSRLGELSDKLDELNRTVTSLNTTVKSLREQLGDCRAENLLISNRINELQDEINRLKELNRQLEIYTGAGVVSLAVLISLLFLMSSRRYKLAK
ncbi:MAG: hypothetical protein ABWW65_05675 [Thermoprotei archaeon]